jgi:hypothetical protein
MQLSVASQLTLAIRLNATIGCVLLARIAKIRAFIDGWNDRYHPFAWAKTVD